MHKLLLFISLIILSYMTLGQSVQDSFSTGHDSLETTVSQSCDTADMTKEKNRHRVIVLTDIGGTDFDDFQSMVHFLLYADLFDVEGLISSTMGGQGRIDHIHKVIDCYEKDYVNLKTYSDRYPTPETLRAITRQGAIDSAGLRGYTKPSSGSEWIIQCAKRNDIRPLWILVWGGIDDLAQALHDDPSIQPKLRVYFIGGPNKKWATTAYDYIAREHPNLWIIEANSTYRGWFVGGNQQDPWGNDSFVAKHIAGRGALGEFYAKGITFESQIRSTIKMGDTPSVAYLLGKTPEDPSRESWGGSFIRSWDRPRYTFRYPPTTEDKIESFSIVEIIYAAGQSTSADDRATLVVDKQDFPGFADDTGAWHFFFSPKQAKTWNYTIKSTIQKLDNQTGGFTSFWPQPEQAVRPSSRYPNWWTDNPDPSVAEGVHQGAKTVSRWREEFLGDFAQRMLRCQSPAPSQPEGSVLNTGGDSKVSTRPRVIIMSDFPPLDVIPGGAGYGPQEKRSDPDDVQSMVRFLLYVNEFDVEGLVASAGTFANIAKKQNILDILDLYDKVNENLNRHDPRYPTADQLRSIVFQGCSGSWGKPADEILGEGKDSEASEAIIRIVDKPDSRSVWVCVWGGPREAAQAIWKVQKTRSPAELERFLSKLRIYMIGLGDKTGQDGSGQWMLDNFPNLFVIVSQKTYHGMFAQKSSIGSLEWLNDKIRQGHGPLGAVYPPAGYNPDNPGMQEGDTPSFLYLVSAVRGMNDPEKPDQESWGGQYQQPDTSRNHWYDGPGAISVSKWLPEIQKDFAMRADWMLPSHATSLKPRIIVLTDISPVNHEPDDMESM